MVRQARAWRQIRHGWALLVLAAGSVWFGACTESNGALVDSGVDGGGPDAFRPEVDAALAPRDADAQAPPPDSGPPVCGMGCDPVEAAACDPLDASSIDDADEADAAISYCMLRDIEPACYVAGTHQEGEACSSVNECAPGLGCFLPLGSSAVCARICCPGDPHPCTDDEICHPDGTLVSGRKPPWGHCAPREIGCDVLAAEETVQCGREQACYFTSLASDARTECFPRGRGAVGDVCVEQNDCGARMVCLGALGPSRCARLCEFNSGACPNDTACVAQVFSPTDIGICTGL